MSLPLSPAPPNERLSILDLPPEIICRCFLYLCHLPATLRAAALACSAFTDPAQRALHTHVVLLQAQNDDELDRKVDGWLISPGRREYRVRTMVLSAGAPARFVAERVLAVCDGLEELELVCVSRFYSELLSYPSLSSLQSLILPGPDWLNLPLYRVIPRPASFSLKHLQLGGLYAPSEDLITVLIPPTSRLLSLEFIALFTPQASDDGNLHAPLVTALPHIAQTLNHLRVALLSFPSPLLPLLSTCSTLTKLTVEFAMHGTTAHLRNLLKLGSALPLLPTPTISHLKLEGFVRIHSDLEVILAFIRLPNLAGLEEIDVPGLGVWVVVGTGDPLCDEFLRECRGRGIKVRCRHEWI